MDSLLHIETKKLRLRQTDKNFNFHSVSLLSQVPLAHESRALPSLYYGEEIARISHFCRSAEMDFQHLAGPRNLGVDLKCDVLCLYVFV